MSTLPEIKYTPEQLAAAKARARGAETEDQWVVLNKAGGGGAMKTKHTYVVESLHNGKWIELFENTRDYCLGYVSHVQYCAPRKAYRIVRSDGKVMQELPAAEDCSIGMIAGWPTPEQYEGAAQRALEQAARIRRQREKLGNYHDNTR